MSSAINKRPMMSGVVDASGDSKASAWNINCAEAPAHVEQPVYAFAVVEGSDDLPCVVDAVEKGIV